MEDYQPKPSNIFKTNFFLAEEIENSSLRAANTQQLALRIFISDPIKIGCFWYYFKMYQLQRMAAGWACVWPYLSMRHQLWLMRSKRIVVFQISWTMVRRPKSTGTLLQLKRCTSTSSANCISRLNKTLFPLYRLPGQPAAVTLQVYIRVRLKLIRQ